MKRIFYSSGSVVTGDRVADTIVRYAEILALRDASDAIDVPIALASGQVGRAQLLIGPASQLAVVPEDLVLDDPSSADDPETIAELERRIARHGSTRPQASENSDTTDYADANGYNDASEQRRE
jgi:ABC-type histidine transport system ATPase subunit